MAALPVVSHRKARDFKGGGLRDFFQYRDLGIRQATRGRVGAHVIRAAPEGGKKRIKGSGAHRHALDFQMVYVLKGWVEFEYEGYGKVRLKAGSSVYQPPGIRHREIAHSRDLELIEITQPAEFDTRPATMPAKRRRRR
ncbi:MAG: cupin domain-containing protein [Alphaproteobacteria bacterium]|nr:cupin domain-containing protein [Alphaproteobacteria bacterium]